MSPKVSQPGIGRKLVDNHVLGCARQHGLAPVRQIAQPRSAIDRRTGVVAFIAQLYLAGMQADAQPDRRKRCPLQLKRARHRVGRAGERRHKTVALGLFHRPHPPWAAMTSETVWLRRAIAAVISSGWVSHSRVDPSTSASSSVAIPVGKSPLTPSSLQSTSGVSAHGSISLMLARMRSPRAENISGSRVHGFRQMAGTPAAASGIPVFATRLPGAELSAPLRHGAQPAVVRSSTT